MQRYIFLLLIIIGLLFWVGWRGRERSKNTTVAAFTAAILMSLLLIGAALDLFN